MAAFKEHFSNRALIVGIDCPSNSNEDGRELNNMRIALKSGANGVFFNLPHRVNVNRFFNFVRKAKALGINMWSGYNLSPLTMKSALKIANSLGLWVDDPGIRPNGDRRTPDREIAGRRIAFDQLLFGGVGFHTPRLSINALLANLRVAKDYVDVLALPAVVGGDLRVGTVKRAREMLGDTPIAVAQGITPENVEMFTPLCDCVLVRKGLFDPNHPGTFAHERVERIVSIVHNHRAARV